MARYRLPEPIFESKRGNFIVTLKNDRGGAIIADTPAAPIDLLTFCREPRTREEIAGFLGKTQYYAMSRFVAPLLDAGKLKLTLPDKPKSRNQRYYSG